MERYNRNRQTSCWLCFGRYDLLGETKWRDMTCIRNLSWWISPRSSDRGGKIKIIEMEFTVGELVNFWSFCQTSLLLSSIKCQMSRQYPDEQQYVWCVVNLNRKFHACVWFFLTFSNFPTLAPSWQVTLAHSSFLKFYFCILKNAANPVNHGNCNKQTAHHIHSNFCIKVVWVFSQLLVESILNLV